MSLLSSLRHSVRRASSLAPHPSSLAETLHGGRAELPSSSAALSAADLDFLPSALLPSPAPFIPFPDKSRYHSNVIEDSFLYGPSEIEALDRQLAREEQTASTAMYRHRAALDAAAARGDVGNHYAASHLVLSWLPALTLAITRAQESLTDIVKQTNTSKGRKCIRDEALPLLKHLPPDVLSAAVVHEVLGHLIRDANGTKLVTLACAVGNAVRTESNAAKLRELEAKQRELERAAKETHPLDSTGGIVPTKKKPRKRALVRGLNACVGAASVINYAALQAEVANCSWTPSETVQVGALLIDLLVRTACVPDTMSKGTPVPAFKHFRKYMKTDTLVGALKFEDAVLRIIAQDGIDLSPFLDLKHQPMEVRPRPWISPRCGAYLKNNVGLIRAYPSKALDNALAAADMHILYDGLNALGDTPWRVNRGVLDVGARLWQSGGGIAGLVTKQDVEVPTKAKFLRKEAEAFALEQRRNLEKATNTAIVDGHKILRKDENENLLANSPQFDETAALRRLKYARRKARKINRELFSLRADTQYKLSQAKAFGSVPRFYLPHNVDFRGRAYPIPVYLQHMGADLTRAMLTFADGGQRLGPRGVYWLKVHLANLLGEDKLSLEERVSVAEDSLPRAIDAGLQPLEERNLEWWTQYEDPFQLLAVCQEFAHAVGRHGGQAAMEDFVSALPVSMDGSCNGLQHYAALGRDIDGGQQVNLTRSERPQDVYSGVARLVAKRVEEKSAQGDEIARLLDGRITRKIVKQTVMTSVYGVTLIGARDQIANRLRELKFLPDDKVFPASILLAKMTLDSLGDMFSGATKTMDWLSDAAQAIAREGHEVQWTTPIGLPVVQPYRRKSRAVVKTVMQRVVLESVGEHLPVSTARQRSAFPPNFVHSIDSAHMILTANACAKKGITYAAVHDSFWTNAACVDQMNSILRKEFVKLHSRPLLEELKESFEMKFPYIKFRALPQRGLLDLQEVLDSPYFFS